MTGTTRASQTVTNYDHVYLNGRWLQLNDADPMKVQDSFSEEVIANVSLATTSDVEAAVNAASVSLPGWSATPIMERIEFVRRIADELSKQQEELARSITQEVGMPLTLSARIQVDAPIEAWRQYARAAQHFEFTSQIGHSTILQVPVGVVACLTPWNYPLHQITAKVAPALLAGCTCILKPSEQAPAAAYALARAVERAGVPSGVFNLLIGDGPDVGAALVNHSKVQMVSFTGSTAVGQLVAQQAAGHMKRLALELGGKSAMIVRDLMVGNPRLAELGFGEEALGHNAILAGFQGQRQWTDHAPNGDFMEAILNSSFDWNGIRAPHIFATENDSLNGATMLLSYLLTNRAQIFADVRTYWSPEAVERVTGQAVTGPADGGFIHLINSGAATLDATGAMEQDGKPAMKPFWEISAEDVQAALAATTWYPANRGYFRGGGYSSQFVSRGGMPVTMARLNIVSGGGPVLQLAEGWTVELPKAVHDVLDQRTDPTWPTHWFVPRVNGVGAFRDVYTVMANWAANHGAISYGHIGADLITLASILRIPVHMHNVDEQDIFRPSAWANLGTSDLEGADFRACANFGPLYGRQ